MKEKDNAAAFNERLAVLLKQNGLTQKELAIEAGVTEAAMSHYLKGDRHPRASVLARIAGALDTTTDYLITGNEDAPLDEIKQATCLIARNADQMTKQQKMEIIDILMSDD